MPREAVVDAVGVVEVDAAVVERVFQEGAVEVAPQGMAVSAGVERRRAGASRRRGQAARKPPEEVSRQGLVSASPDQQPRV